MLFWAARYYVILLMMLTRHASRLAAAATAPPLWPTHAASRFIDDFLAILDGIARQ